MGNLLGGSYVCWVAAADGNLTDGVVAAIWLAAMICDLLDGLVARKLGVDGRLGVQLDSLADLVTGGLAPAFVAYRLLIDDAYIFSGFLELTQLVRVFPWAIVIAAAYRLARYNVSVIDGSDGKYFEGLPAPASGMFWLGIIIWVGGTHTLLETQAMFVVAGLGLILLPILMILKTKFFSLKGWGENSQLDKTRKVFIALSTLVVSGVFIAWNNVFAAAPLCVLLYSCFAFMLAPK
tara:strand:- start:722 stop:1429 length:708 start_codon:yes stop_codon:yes gene_type:complete